MIALLRILGLRGVLLVALVAVVLALAIRIDWLTSSRDAAEAKLTAVEIDLQVARADADQAENRLKSVVSALETERELARRNTEIYARLRERIAKESGTDRDGQTAPILEDTIRGLQERSDNRDGQSVVPASSSLSPSILEDVFVVPLARQYVSWTLTVVVAGKVELVAPVEDGPSCRDAAGAVVQEIKTRAEFESELKGRVLIVCASGRRMDA